MTRSILPSPSPPYFPGGIAVLAHLLVLPPSSRHLHRFRLVRPRIRPRQRPGCQERCCGSRRGSRADEARGRWRRRRGTLVGGADRGPAPSRLGHLRSLPPQLPLATVPLLRDEAALRHVPRTGAVAAYIAGRESCGAHLRRRRRKCPLIFLGATSPVALASSRLGLSPALTACMHASS